MVDVLLADPTSVIEVVDLLLEVKKRDMTDMYHKRKMRLITAGNYDDRLDVIKTGITACF